MENSKPIARQALLAHLAPRPPEAHKGLFGHVLIIGGDHGMAGAVRLAGEAALRVGAGLVTIATRPDHVSAIVSARPELMVHGVTKSQDLQPLTQKATVIVLGPGLGQSVWSRHLFEWVLPLPHWKVLDADALNLLTQQPSLSDRWILTPHPGEAARLLNVTSAHVQADRLTAVRQIQALYGGVTVLKGAGTLVAKVDEVSQCSSGNPGMASGGMGDVLSGVLGGLLAQGMDLYPAAQLAVSVHGEAGDRAALALGQRGLLASDLMPHLHALVNA